MQPQLNYSTDTQQKKQYVTFKLGNELFGVEVLHVQEILKAHEMTPVPLAADYVSGLINLRGQIVTAIDLGLRLTNRNHLAKKESMNVVVNCDDGTVSLLVDEIGDVLELDNSLMEPVPPTVKTIRSEYLKGVCKLKDGLMMLLDVEKILTVQIN